MTPESTARLERYLDRLRAGDETVQEELLNAACSRLRELARVMLRDYQRLKRWEETDDVLQNALVRLCRALREVPPATLKDFYRLAALSIRRELIDLARHYYGPEGQGRHHQSNPGGDNADSSFSPAHDAADSTEGPGQMAQWGEFHQQAQALPAEEGEVFDLIWYQGLSHAETAVLLGVSTKTVQRRWNGACRKLHAALQGELPGT